MSGLILDEVSRVFAGVRAVDRLSLQVQAGEFLVLVGKSGCGKTTTLRLIAGLDRPTSGQILIQGRSVANLPPRARNVAMVFQHPGLYPHLSVFRNIAFGLEVRKGGGVWQRLIGRGRGGSNPAGNGQPTTAGRVREVAGWLGLEQLLDRKPGELSGGERQRVALARAIVRRPGVFLLDEPLAGLDAGLRMEMRRLLAQLHERVPTTTVYVTHDQAEALALAQRVAVMNAGRIEQVGSPRDVYERPANRFVAEFIGSPPMNFLAGRLVERGGDWSWEGAGWSAEVPARVAAQVAAAPVEFGLRAEDLELVPATGGASVIGVSGRASVSALVRRIETLGADQLVELEFGQTGEHRNATCCVVTRVPGRMSLKVGQRVLAAWDFGRAHWFELVSRRRLGLTRSS